MIVLWFHKIGGVSSLVKGLKMLSVVLTAVLKDQKYF